MNKKNIESIFSLTTIQKGLLFYSLKDGEEGAYIGQHCLYLKGKIDEKVFEKSIDILNKKYDIFRTRIVYSGLENPVQLVLQDDKTQFFYSENMSPEEYIEADRKKGFVFEKENMIRVALIKISENEYCNVWSFHHILIDGYSIAILAKDFFEIYGKIKTDEDFEILPAPSYKKFVNWLAKQDMNLGKEYWESYISGEKKQALYPVICRGKALRRRNTVLR